MRAVIGVAGRHFHFLQIHVPMDAMISLAFANHGVHRGVQVHLETGRSAIGVKRDSGCHRPSAESMPPGDD